MNLMKKILLAQATVLALWAVSAQAVTDEEIAQRIKPVGVVCIQGDECDKAAAAASAAASTATDTVASAETAAPAAAAAGRSADEIITKHCAVCHTTGLVGAPISGETAVWQERADAKGGLEGLLETSITGLNAMPPKGTCSDCTNEELMAAIKSMSGL